MSRAIADQVLDANYTGPHGHDAAYAGPGCKLPLRPHLRVMRGGQEVGLQFAGLSAQPALDQAVLRVRVSELAQPKKDGVFKVDGETYKIAFRPERLDRARREWTCVCISRAPTQDAGQG